MTRRPVAGEVRAPQPHELDAFADCIEIGFSTPFTASARERYLASLDLERSLATFEDGQLIGTLAAHLVEHTLPGPLVAEALAITEAAVVPTHRRQGVLSAMVERFLADAHGRGDVLAVLSASEGAIYGRFGFGPASWCCRYRVERARARLIERRRGPGRVRLITPEEARSCVPGVFDAARRARVGEVGRLGDWWDELFDQPARPDDPRFFACFERDGSIDGYVAYEVITTPSASRRHHEREVVLTELVATTDAAELGLWEFLLGIDLTARVRTTERPVDETVRHVLVDPRALEVDELRDRTWVRLVDAEAALSARRYAGAGHLVIALEDEDCAWNSGCLALDVDENGAASVTRSAEAAMLTLGPSELACTYLGGTSFTALVAAGRVDEGRPGAADLADRLFGSARAPFCSVEL